MKENKKKNAERGEQISIRLSATEVKDLERLRKHWGYETRSQAIRGLLRSASAIHARSAGRVAP